MSDFLKHSSEPVWSAVAITAANPKQAHDYQQELLLRQRRGLIHEDTLLLAVPDPTSARIGSGGGDSQCPDRGGRAFVRAGGVFSHRCGNHPLL